MTGGTVTVNSPTLAAVPLEVGSGAAVGPHTITLTTGAETVSATLQVTPGLPEISRVSPNVVLPGQTASISIQGVFTNFQPDATVDFGENVTVQAIAVNSATSLTATVKVTAGAALTAHDVIVRSGGQVYRVPLGITIAINDLIQPTVGQAFADSPVPLNAQVILQYSKPFKRSTLTATSVQMSDPLGVVPVKVTQDASGRYITLIPERLLAASSPVSFSVIGVTDVFGNSGPANGGFTTGSTIDQSLPVATAVSPGDSETGVPTNAVISLRLSKSVDPASAASGIVISGPGGILPGTLSFDYPRRVITFQPAVPLAPQTSYSVTYSAALSDTMGNGIANPGVHRFTTGNGPDSSFFDAILTSPEYSTVNVPLNTLIGVRFMPFLDSASVTSTITDTNSVPVPTVAEPGPDPNVLTLRPLSALRPFTTYSVVVNACSETKACAYVPFSFTAGSTVDTLPPTVTTISPSDGTLNVPVNGRISFQMTEQVDPTFVSDSMIQLTPPVPGSLLLDSVIGNLSFTPATYLATSTQYSVSISGLRDLAGNVMAPTAAGSFTTSDSGTPVTRPVKLLSSYPANSATGVPIRTPIILNFNAPISAALLSRTSVMTQVNGFLFAGTVALTGPKQVTFTPIGAFPSLAVVTVSGEVVDLAGNTGPVSLAFTTSETVDTERPRILSMSPADGAVNVPPATQITLTFSKSIDPNSLTGSGGIAAFAGQQLVSFSTTISADNRTVTLMLGNAPAPSIMSVVLGPGITDLSGNALQPTQSSYTTTSTLDATAPRVTLQMPAMGTTLTGPTPTITLFMSKPMDGSSLADAVSLIQGGIVVPVAVSLPQPQAIVIQPSVPLKPNQSVSVGLSGAADTTGIRIYDYKATFRTAPTPATVPASLLGTSPGFSSTAPTDTVIDLQFSKALDQTTVNASTVVLSLNGNPVASSLELRNGLTTIRIKPNALLTPSATYSVSEVGVLDVNGLSAPMVNMTFYTGKQPAGTPPVIVGIAPAGAHAVGTNASVRVTFSGPIDPATVTASTIRLASQSGLIAPADIWFDSIYKNVTLTPSVALPAGTVMKITVDGVEDVAGQKITPLSVLFTTGGGPDTVPPTVVTSNIQSSQNLPVNLQVAYKLSEAIDRRSLAGQYVLTDQSSRGVPGTLSFSADSASFTFTPAQALKPQSSYNVNLSYQDLAGNQNHILSYLYTSSSSDVTPPTITASNPATGSSGVPTNVRLEVLLNEPASLVDLSHVVLKQGGTVVPITVTADPNLGPSALVATPSTLLKPGVGYTLTVGVSDTAGNAMTPETVSFSTAGLPQLEAAQVVAQDPPPFASNVPLTVQPYITLSVPFNPISLTSKTAVYLAQYYCGNTPVPATATASADGKTVTVAPLAPLSSFSSYNLCVAATDVTGNAVSIQSYFSTAF